MELESYFEFVGPDDIRIKGTRIGVEYILSAYQEGASPEEIALRYSTLSLEQVHAAITYYLHNQADMELYLRRWAQDGEASWRGDQGRARELLRTLRGRLGLRSEDGDRLPDAPRPLPA